MKIVVYCDRFDKMRVIVGKISSGVVRQGDNIVFSPSGAKAKVKAICGWNMPVQLEAHSGRSIGIELEEDIYVERGEVISHEQQLPKLSTVFRVNLFWLSTQALTKNQEFTLRINTTEFTVSVYSIGQVQDLKCLTKKDTEEINLYDYGEVIIHSKHQFALDDYSKLNNTGRCLFLSDNQVVACGLLSMQGFIDQRSHRLARSQNIFCVSHKVLPRERAARYGHQGAVIWLTGLSCAGKSTIAIEAEKQLFNEGFLVYVLDGDNLRQGINANLSFSPEDRSENVRRVGEIAKLFAEAGFICIVAMISPYEEDRKLVKQSVGSKFKEVYINADISTCERRDTKGLYYKARIGELDNFTGIQAPYEVPQLPDLVIDTMKYSVAECVTKLKMYIRQVSVHSVGQQLASVVNR